MDQLGDLCVASLDGEQLLQVAAVEARPRPRRRRQRYFEGKARHEDRGGAATTEADAAGALHPRGREVVRGRSDEHRAAAARVYLEGSPR